MPNVLRLRRSNPPEPNRNSEAIYADADGVLHQVAPDGSETDLGGDPPGGSQPPIPFVQEADPGAVGAGALWIQPTGETVSVRDAADDAWTQIFPSTAADPSLSDVLNTGSDAGGNSITNVFGFDCTDDAAVGGALEVAGSATLSGLIETSVGGSSIAFFGASPATQPVVPLTTPDVQDVIDALAALGLITQSD